jgi:hypothetical protein
MDSRSLYSYIYNIYSNQSNTTQTYRKELKGIKLSNLGYLNDDFMLFSFGRKIYSELLRKY